MALIPVVNVSAAEWKPLQEKHGDGKVKFLGKHADLKAADWPGHHVVRGRYTPAGSKTEQPTSTGYLRIGDDVKGSVGFA